MKIILLFLLVILLDAIGDALNDSRRKGIGHLLQAIYVGLLLLSPFYINIAIEVIGWYLTAYICLRIALFDITYNLTRKLPWNYIGKTSLWDRVRMSFMPPPRMEIFGRLIFLIAGISMIINQLT